MRNTDPTRERHSSLRRSRVARQGLVLGAVAGSLGIAGALGLSSVITKGVSAPSPSNSSTSSNQGNQGGTAPAQTWVLQGGDDGGESDDGGHWVPVAPSHNFGSRPNGGGGNTGSASGGGGGGGGGGSSTGGGSASVPNATSGGS